MLTSGGARVKGNAYRSFSRYARRAARIAFNRFSCWNQLCARKGKKKAEEKVEEKKTEESKITCCQ
jgi:hypothetical protein